jgi:hypothetical protein
VEILPPRPPSEEEREDANAHASNVQREMAAALGVPAVRQDLYDCKAVMRAGFFVDWRGRLIRTDPRTVAARGWV